jgi:hypothetical protein
MTLTGTENPSKDKFFPLNNVSPTEKEKSLKLIASPKTAGPDLPTLWMEPTTLEIAWIYQKKSAIQKNTDMVIA